jgi:hypothetical protein
MLFEEMKMKRERRSGSKMRTRYSLPLTLGCVAAIVHLFLIAGILLSGHSGGSWSEVLAFTIDFPLSITFVWLSHFVPLISLHMTIGSVWWFAIVWTLVRILVWITDRAGRNG